MHYLLMPLQTSIELRLTCSLPHLSICRISLLYSICMTKDAKLPTEEWGCAVHCSLEFT